MKLPFLEQLLFYFILFYFILFYFIYLFIYFFFIFFFFLIFILFFWSFPANPQIEKLSVALFFINIFSMKSAI